MTKKEYLEKRNQLLADAEALINKNDAEGYNAKEQEIKDLDAKFEAIAKAQANYAALKNTAQYLLPYRTRRSDCWRIAKHR